jgi:hypothetical protein
MKKNTLLIARYLSIFLGFASILGFFWYSENYISKEVLLILFSLSTSFTLIIASIVPDKLLKYIVIRVILFSIIVMGIINNIYEMYDDLTFIYGAEWHAFFIRIGFLWLLAILLRRTMRATPD